MVLIILAAESLLWQAVIAAIIIQALLSWFMPMGAGRLTVLLRELTDPILLPLRRMIPPIGMIDISPMIAIILVWLIGSFVHNILVGLAGG